MDEDILNSSEYVRLEALKLAVQVTTQNVSSADRNQQIINRAAMFEEFILLGLEDEDGETS